MHKRHTSAFPILAPSTSQSPRSAPSLFSPLPLSQLPSLPRPPQFSFHLLLHPQPPHRPLEIWQIFIPIEIRYATRGNFHSNTLWKGYFWLGGWGLWSECMGHQEDSERVKAAKQ